MPLRLRWPLLLPVLAGSAACLPGSTAPQVQARGTLQPEPGALLSGEPGPFAVTAASPQGEAGVDPQITVTFSRPLRALDASPPAPPVRLRPEVPGRWDWVGSRALRFSPERPLPRATRFEVEVSAARSLDGAVLAEPYRFSFSTPRPRLRSSSPHDQARGLLPGTHVDLVFDQPVADDAVRASVSLRPQGGAPIAFDVVRPPPASPTLVRLVPRAPLPVHTTFELIVDEHLRGTEGPLEAGRQALWRFSTYGALSVELECSRDESRRCAHDGWKGLRLSNPVKLADLRRALQISPPVKLTWPSWTDDQHPVDTLSLDGAFAPGQRYTVRVRTQGAKGPLRDVHGQALGQEFVGQLDVGDMAPNFRFGIEGAVLEPAQLRDIPLLSINLPRVDVAAAPLDVAALVALEAEPDRRKQIERVQKMPQAKRVEVRASGARNRVQQQGLALGPLLRSGRGAAALAASFSSEHGAREELRIVQVTDLGVSAKVSPQEVVAWVTRLSTGKPVEGATVEAYVRGQSKPAATGRTDASGVARFAAGVLETSAAELHGESEGSALIVARQGDDWSFQRLRDELSPWRYGATSDASDASTTRGLLFAERGVYRPGDVVRLKGLGRTATTGGLTTPAGQAVKGVVTGPEGDKVATFEAKLSAFGGVAHDVTVPHDGKLGTYRVALALGGEESSDAWTTTFEVAEYRPAEFKASAELDRAAYQRGQDASCRARGDYLFGAPMVGAGVNVMMRREPSAFQPPGLDGYTTSDAPYREAHEEEGARRGLLGQASARLDAQGASKLDTRLELPGQTGPEVITCEAEVTDLTHQSFAGAATALVHPGEVYAALRVPGDGFLEVGGPVKAEVLAVQPDGKRRAGVPIEVELIERRYVLQREVTGERLQSTVKVDDRPAGSCRVTSGAGPASCALSVPRGGHFLLRATAEDGRHQRVSASRHLYALGSGASGWGDQEDGSLKLVTDRASYRAGETARVLIQSPFPRAEALVTVEREGVIWQKVIEVQGGTPSIEIPVTEAMLPGAFVGVTLVRGRVAPPPGSDRKPDVGGPTSRMGYVPLRVDTSSRKLAVAVTPARRELRPGDELSVDVSVVDAAGKGVASEVTLYAVDEGVLALTDYRTPDPMGIFFAPRGIRVHTLETRSDLARIRGRDFLSAFDKGLDGGGGGSSRRDFRQTAYFNPSLLTDAQGHARASFRLPDSVTTYRLMAVAATSEDRFGAASADVITSKPVMARPALPRVLRAGDRLEAAVVVTSKGASGRFDVAMTATGLALAGEARQSIELGAGQSREVRFAATAPHAGPARIRFDVKGEGGSDSVEVTREVKSPTVLEASAVSGFTADSAGEKLGDLGALRDDVGGLEVSLASTALSGLAGGVEQLIEYPYGCTEQLTSRLVPLLPLRDLAGALGLSLPDRVDEAVRATVGKVVNNQHRDGGFGLWPESTDSSAWLTAYALWGLDEAQRRGIAVRASALRDATRYLRDSLARPDDRPFDLAERAFVLDVLAERGEADAGAMGRLFERRQQLPVFAQAQLLHAMARGGADRALVQRLTTELEGHLTLDADSASVRDTSSDEFALLLDSPARTSALVLRALVAARPDHPMAPRLVTGLLRSRRGGHWRTTQENAWALLALDAYRRAQEATSPSFQARVFLGQTLLTEASFQGRAPFAQQSHTPMAALQAASGQVMAFTKQGEGRLFYEARLRYARRQLPTRPIESGFFVERLGRVVKPEALADSLASGSAPLTSLAVGDLVRVDLTIVAPAEREFVVVDDPLPAGLEAIDSGLQGLTSWTREQAGLDQEDESRWESPITRRELRDDRVLFFFDRLSPGVHRLRYLARATAIGAFVSPPTRVEEMYTPETFGQTAASTLTITPASLP